MKKIFTLCFGLMAALAVQAQDDFPLQFAYSDGTIIPDGTTLNLSEYEADDFGDIQVPTRLYVKNTSSAAVQGGGTYTVQSLGSGIFQTCFPVNCVQQNRVGTYTTGSDQIAAGDLKNMQTEWFPTAEGTALVTYQLLTFKQNVITKQWNTDREGPKITLSFTYSTTSGISGTQATKGIRSEVYYDMQGRLVSQPSHGLYVRKTTFTDGTSATQKHIIR